MSKRYTYSRTINPTGRSEETFSAVEFDSFDEAIRAVDKGIKDRVLQVIEEEQFVEVETPSFVEVEKEEIKNGGEVDPELSLSNPLPKE